MSARCLLSHLLGQVKQVARRAHEDVGISRSSDDGPNRGTSGSTSILTANGEAMSMMTMKKIGERLTNAVSHFVPKMMMTVREDRVDELKIAVEIRVSNKAIASWYK